jgi:hypothetical protein
VSGTLARVQALAAIGQFRISAHAYNELDADDISSEEVLAGVSQAMLVEDYPNFHLGPCVLVLQTDAEDRPIHVLWGIGKDQAGPAVLITAYRPRPARWSGDFLKRKQT